MRKTNPFILDVKREAEEPIHAMHDELRKERVQRLENSREQYRAMQFILDISRKLATDARPALLPVWHQPMTVMHTWSADAKRVWFAKYNECLIEFHKHATAFCMRRHMDCLGVSFQGELRRMQAMLLELNMHDDTLYYFFQATVALDVVFANKIKLWTTQDTFLGR